MGPLKSQILVKFFFAQVIYEVMPHYHHKQVLGFLQISRFTF